MTATVIRQISAGEGARLRQIRIEALSDTPDAFGASLAETLAQTEEGWNHWAESSAAGLESVMYIAVAGGVWIGMAGGRLDPSQPGSPAHVLSMWVAAPYRGQGLGRRLVEHIIEWARSRGARRLQLC